MIIKRLLVVAVVVVAILALVFVYLPTVSRAPIVSAPCDSEDCSAPNDPATNPSPIDDSAPVTVPPPADGDDIGEATVKITVYFTDGTNKVITGVFGVLNVKIDNKPVSHIRYEMSVRFENVGVVQLGSVIRGLYLVLADGTSKLITENRAPSQIQIQDGASGEILGWDVSSTVIESFLRTQNLPNGVYAIRFYTQFLWIGSNEGRHSIASVLGPDVTAIINKPEPVTTSTFY